MSALRDSNPAAYDRGVELAVEERDAGLDGMKAQVAALESLTPAALFKDSNGAATIGVMRWGIERIEAAQAAERGEADER